VSSIFFFKGSTGTYLIGKVVTNYMSGEVNIGASYLRGFSKVYGEWHSHGSNSIYWSFTEEDLTNQYRVPVYLSASGNSGLRLMRNYRGSNCYIEKCGISL